MKLPFLRSTVQDQLSLYVFVVVLFIAGVLFGVLMAGGMTLEQQQQLTADIEHLARLLHAGMGPDEAQIFWERAWFHTKWLLWIWLLGITVVGLPFIFALDFLKGVLIGFSVGLLISQHAWKGVLFALMSIAPQNLIILPALLIASVSAASFSIQLIKKRMMQQHTSFLPPFLAHSGVILTMLVMLWAASLLEAYISPVLMGWTANVLIVP
ncbi:stage II sporulation protein M [Paenibacillaceae bacterium]|nr:stage II sporulation protein M [Paenibacillaceae bacterium]